MDDYDPPFQSTSTALPPPISRPSRQRKSTSKAYNPDSDDLAPPPKLRVKIGRGGASKGGDGGGGGGVEMDPFAIGWDRELDSDPDEPLAVEEQFILRVPPHLAPLLRDAVERREVPPDVWFKFKDSRRAVFHAGDKLYGAKLVDLPTLSESQKMTGSGGNVVKVADISQMLLVEEEVADEAQVTKDRTFNIEDFIYPHGLLPPLRHVRKRRFRKRINRRTIETVENAVEQLLENDARADKVQYELLDNYMSDDEYDPPSRDANAARDTDSVGAPTPARDLGDDGGDDEGYGDGGQAGDDDDDAGSGYDSDLAKEINAGLEALNASADEVPAADGSDDSDRDGLFGCSDDDDEEEEEDTADDPETIEQKRRIKLLLEETGDLERAIASKEVELGKANNPIFKKRFEEMIKKLTVERDLKKSQHAVAVREMEKKKESEAMVEAAAAAASVAAAASLVPPGVPQAGVGMGEAPLVGDDAMDQS